MTLRDSQPNCTAVYSSTLDNTMPLHDSQPDHTPVAGQSWHAPAGGRAGGVGLLACTHICTNTHRYEHEHL